MHGKGSPVLVLEIDTRSDREVENDRLREIARHSEKITDGSKKPCPKKMLDDLSGPMIERNMDMVLFDHMGMGDESSLFDESSRRRQGYAMGLSDDDIDALSGQRVHDDIMSGKNPKSMDKFKNDFKDLQKFGGDVVALEMDRDVVDSMPGMSDMEVDSMLGASMTDGSMMDMSDPMSEAMASLKEQFGSDVRAVLDGEADGYAVFSVESPEMGQVKYIYDSKDGVGRVLRG